MDYFTLRRQIAELAENLADKPLLARAIDVPGRSFSLHLKRRNGWNDLVISLDNPGQGLRLADNCSEIERSSSLVRTVNRLLTNARLTGIKLAGSEPAGQFDRVVRLDFMVIDSFFGNRSNYSLFCEFTGRVADVFVCDADLKIIDRFSRTSNNLIGGFYRLPDSQPLLNPITAGDQALLTLLAAPASEWQHRLGGCSPQFAAELAFRSGAGEVAGRLVCLRELCGECLAARPVSVYLRNDRFKTMSCFGLTHIAPGADYEFKTVNEAMNWLESFLAGPHRFNETRKRLLANMQHHLRQKNDLLEDQRRLGEKFAAADHYQNLGNLLTASLYRIKPGSSSVELEDWQTGQMVTVELDASRSPAANAARFFNLYKKARRGTIEVEKRIEAIQGEISWLNEQIWLIESADCEADLPVEEKKTNIQRGRNAKEPAAGRRGRVANIRPTYEIDGCRFYVGRNARQNDVLTFQVARRGDWWFHANDVPGAHVILKKPESDITETDLWRGAVLAAWFSFARESSKVAVDATETVFVKRIPGGMPGRVSFTNQRTIMVDPAAASAMIGLADGATQEAMPTAAKT